jgi:cytoskeletal protein CcmA (bactofilin family)
MFTRRRARPADPPPAESAPERFTYVHQGTTVRGTLEATGRVRIDGTVLGDVVVQGMLEVAENGVIEGARVEASEVRVLGVVRAAVQASVKLEIWSGGTVEGDVATPSLDVEEGATLHGRSDMLVVVPALDAAAGDGAEVSARELPAALGPGGAEGGSSALPTEWQG